MAKAETERSSNAGRDIQAEELGRATGPRAQVERIWNTPEAQQDFVEAVTTLLAERKLASFFIRNQSDLDELDQDFELMSYGGSPREPLGFAAVLNLGSDLSLEELFECAECGEFDSYFDEDGHSIRFDQIEQFEGFEAYHSGSVIFLHKLEAFEPGNGVGSELLEHLLAAPDLGIVFLHARNAEAEAFFLDRGFVDSGIRAGDEPVLVYVSD